MKTKEELNALKAEIETLNKKLAELTDEELEQVSSALYRDDPMMEQDMNTQEQRQLI